MQFFAKCIVAQFYIKIYSNQGLTKIDISIKFSELIIAHMFPQDLFSIFNKPSKKEERSKQRQFDLQEENKELETPFTKKIHTEQGEIHVNGFLYTLKFFPKHFL